MAYTITRKGLILDLHTAFEDAKRGKASKQYVKVFEKRLRKNIESLADELINRTYKPEPSSCFIIDYPKKREVFAAQFKDRVLHHLYYNYTHRLYERTFIYDSYSCIPERGTHFGIDRLVSHIRQESDNWQKECYVMKIDIRGYFMHINRERLLAIALGVLDKMSGRKITKGSAYTYGEYIDMELVKWLTKEIVMLDPKTNCHVVGNKSDWDNLDKNKSLFWTNEGCGLPIGNLTSQLFSNVYMNVFDQFMKCDMGFKHYGRYVDDAYVVCCDKQRLLAAVPVICEFLNKELGLELHRGKLMITEAKQGVEFLGGFVKPYRTYVSNSSIKRTTRRLRELNMRDKGQVWRSVNSFLGMMAHFDSYNLRSNLFLRKDILRVSTFDMDMRKLNKPLFNNINI